MAPACGQIASMSNKFVTVSFESLVEAYEMVSMDTSSEIQAYICVTTGKIYVISDTVDLEEEVPDNLETSDNYLCLPNKKELNLGRNLVFSFVQENLPHEYEGVRKLFRNRGAYSWFKALLGLRGKLEAWYKFEEEATKSALREWWEENGIGLAPR